MTVKLGINEVIIVFFLYSVQWTHTTWWNCKCVRRAYAWDPGLLRGCQARPFEDWTTQSSTRLPRRLVSLPVWMRLVPLNHRHQWQPLTITDTLFELYSENIIIILYGHKTLWFSSILNSCYEFNRKIRAIWEQFRLLELNNENYKKHFIIL